MGSLKLFGSGSVVAVALLGVLLTGCATDPQAVRRPVAFQPPPGAPPPSDYVDPEFPVPEDYVYYPAYQVYYSNYRREYVYLEQGNWVSRPTPPRAIKKKLSSSPSVRVGFSDSPSLHHAEVAGQYPKNWVPTGEAKEAQHDDKRKDDRGHK